MFFLIIGFDYLFVIITYVKLLLILIMIRFRFHILNIGLNVIGVVRFIFLLGLLTYHVIIIGVLVRCLGFVVCFGIIFSEGIAFLRCFFGDLRTFC